MRTKRFILDVEGQIEIGDMTLLIGKLEELMRIKARKLKSVKVEQANVMGEHIPGVIK